jgi:hypothetical protein
MDQPKCNYCEKDIKDGSTFVDLGGGTVNHTEPQNDAGGGIFHSKCAVKYIRKNYMNR